MMKHRVSERRNLAFVISGVTALIIGSIVIGSVLFYTIQEIPNITGVTEASGCTLPSSPHAKTLYLLSKSFSSPTITLTALGINGQQHWSQRFATLSTPARGSLVESHGLVYAFITSQTVRNIKHQNHIFTRNVRIINIVAAYNANTGRKLWNVQAPRSGLIEGMSVCNDLIYLWTGNTINAFDAHTGKPLWYMNKLTFFNSPHIIVTHHAIVFTSKGRDHRHITLYAFDPKKGRLLWKNDIAIRSEQGHSALLSLTATDKAVYMSQLSKDSPQKVQALSIFNGKLLWHTSIDKNINTSNIQFASTIVHSNILYLYATNIDLIVLNALNGVPLWTGSNINQLRPLQDRLYVIYNRTADFCQLDPITGKRQWCMATKATSTPIEAVSSQSTVYVASPTGVSALQKANGKLSWVYKDRALGTPRILTYALWLDN